MLALRLAFSWSRMTTAALKAEIQMQSGKAPLEAEVGKLFGHSNGQVEARSLTHHILFLMKSATGAVRRENWGASSIILYLANPGITHTLDVTESEAAPSKTADTLFTSGLLSISPG